MLLGGQPLITHALEAALGAESVSAVYVTTDDDDIGDIARSCGAKVIMRPADLAGDEASSESALLHALQAIPSDVYEAAEMDGASKWRVFSKITMPLLMPTMVVVIVLSLIRAVQAFDEIFVLTGGGPGSATLLILQYIYETGFAFRPQLFGVAAAASILMAAVLLVLTLLQLRATRGQTGG